MRGVKSIRQLGVEFGEKHRQSFDYAQDVLRTYFRRVRAEAPEMRTIGHIQQVYRLRPPINPTPGERIILDAVAYYPENLTVAEVLALKDVS